MDSNAVWTQKLQASAAHQSHTTAHWMEHIRRHNAFDGARCHRPYAEGLRRLPLALVHHCPAYAYLPEAPGGCQGRKRSHEDTRL
jgi:hypothetical protein